MNNALSFEDFCRIKPQTEDVKYNYCPDCNIPMVISGVEYRCEICGLTQTYFADSCKDHSETISMSIRISTGANKGRFYNASSDYAKTQKRIILEQLLQNWNKFEGNPFPKHILGAAATQYNEIQKLITEDIVNEHGVVCGQKKFVRRGNIKDEILAALIYFGCLKENIVRKKRDIAIFMKLSTNGFSRGENVVRTMVAERKIVMELDPEDHITGFVGRYMDALDLENNSYTDFVVELVEESEKLKIGMNSQLSSKIVGAMWILVSHLDLGITSQQLEKACDNTKKNTFTKFTKKITEKMSVFKPIFAKHNVPLRARV